MVFIKTLRKYIKPVGVLGAVLALSACSGGGGGTGGAGTSGTNLTPSAPSVSLNSSFGATMQGVRATRTVLPALTYDPVVGQAAQEHANDNFLNDRATTPGDTIDGIDIGSRITNLGYAWEDIEVLRDRGERTVAEQATRVANDTSCDAFGGSFCVDQAEFEHFGVGRAGSGGDMRWVFIMTDPTN
ncbi:MAG: hypothetical protein AAF718_10535 [Pseudomonadota bacterium]